MFSLPMSELDSVAGPPPPGGAQAGGAGTAAMDWDLESGGGSPQPLPKCPGISDEEMAGSGEDGGTPPPQALPRDPGLGGHAPGSPPSGSQAGSDFSEPEAPPGSPEIRQPPPMDGGDSGSDDGSDTPPASDDGALPSAAAGAPAEPLDHSRAPARPAMEDDDLLDFMGEAASGGLGAVDAADAMIAAVPAPPFGVQRPPSPDVDLQPPVPELPAGWGQQGGSEAGSDFNDLASMSPSP